MASKTSLFSVRYYGQCKDCGKDLQKFRPSNGTVQRSGEPCRVRCRNCGQITPLEKTEQ